MTYFYHHHNKGFTLVELVISVFVFSVLIGIAGGIFVSSLNLQRKAINIKKIEENGRFILEVMTREIRVANPINTPDNNCPTSPTSTLSFVHPVNGNIEYSLVNKEVHRKVETEDTTISNPDVEVTKLNFCISGNAGGDNKQPRVTILLSLKAGLGKEEVSLDLQTTVSQRGLSD